MNSEWRTSPRKFFLISLSQSGASPNWHRLPRLLRVSSNIQRAVTLFQGIWLRVRRSFHNSCAAAFERYRTEGCEGVLMYVYTVENLKNEKKTEILLAFQLHRGRSEITPRIDASLRRSTNATRIGSIAGGALRLTPAVLVLDIVTHGR